MAVMRDIRILIIMVFIQEAKEQTGDREKQGQGFTFIPSSNGFLHLQFRIS